MKKLLLIAVVLMLGGISTQKAEAADIWLPTIYCFEAQCITSDDAEAKSRGRMEGHFFCPGPLCSERMAGDQIYHQFVVARDIELCVERTYAARHVTNPQSLWYTFLGTPAYFPTYASTSAPFLNAGVYASGPCDPDASTDWPDPFEWPGPPNSN